MTKLIARTAAVALIAAFATTAISYDGHAAKGPYDAKKAECKQRAKAMHFGVHVIKKNRWVKDCIAGAH
jgi:hypothetical protein